LRHQSIVPAARRRLLGWAPGLPAPGRGSAYVIPSGTVSPLAGIKAAAGSGTSVAYSQGLPIDTALPAIPSSDLTPAYAPTPFGGSYTGTLTAPETGTYVLAITNPCGCYTSTYLSLDGKQIIDNPSTPPVHTYSVAVSLTKGQTYTLAISGDSSQLLWGTPSALAPGINAAVAAAKSASVAVVVVSDDTESEATDRPSLNLPSAQDELISAVAAANPHTVVVIDAGAPVAMPWLSTVAGVLDAWYPGQTSGTSLASVLFGQTDPGGHLPVSFPASLSQVPAATTAQFPGNGRLRRRDAARRPPGAAAAAGLDGGADRTDGVRPGHAGPGPDGHLPGGPAAVCPERDRGGARDRHHG
jgi:beta-glucosidase